MGTSDVGSRRTQMNKRKEQIFSLMKLYWETDSEVLKDLIVKSIFETLKIEEEI